MPGTGDRDRNIPSIPLVIIAVVVCLSVGVFFAVFQYYINVLFAHLETQYRQGLVNIVSVARNAVEPVLAEVRSGGIGRDEAIKRLRDIIRNMTYEDQDGKNYIFFASYDGVLLVHPYERDKEMSNQLDLKDANGVYVYREFIKAAKTIPKDLLCDTRPRISQRLLIMKKKFPT